MPRLAVVLVALVAHVAGMLVLVAASRFENDGNFTFPLDDAYIHLGLARRLVDSGTWGLNPGEFVSASSSPVWTASLAVCDALFGSHALSALGLAGLAGLAAIGVVAWVLREESVLTLAVALAALLVLVPLPFVSALGMEHALHVVVVLAFAGAFVLDPSRARTVALGTTIALASLVRYETVFVTLAATGLLAFRRDRAALVVVTAGSLPPLLFGLWSMERGGFFVPNSLLMKSGTAWQAYDNATLGGPVWLLVGVSLALWLSGERDPRRDHAVPLFALVATLHLLFARTGWYFRYEAWLLAWGLVVLTPYAMALARRTLGAVLLLPALGVPLGVRAYTALSTWDDQVRFIYDADVIPAQVLAHLPPTAVATHDIGAVSFYTDHRIVDVAGLGSDDIARLHVANGLTRDRFDEVIRAGGSTVAVTSRGWMSDDLPRSFVPIGNLRSWVGTLGAVDLRVSTIDDADPEPLRAALRQRRLTGSGRVTVVLGSDVPCDLGSAVLEGGLVEHQGEGVHFYSDGLAHFRSPADGELWLRVRGELAGGRGPRFSVAAGGPVVELAADADTRYVLAGNVDAGAEVWIRYHDDFSDTLGDRNLFLESAFVDVR